MSPASVHRSCTGHATGHEHARPAIDTNPARGADDLRAELARVLGDDLGNDRGDERGDASVLPRAFDPTDDEHLEQAAGRLLHRFRDRDDVEAYVLLVELSQTRLRQLAATITRRLGVMIDPDDLVAGLMARLFTDVKTAAGTEPVRRFLSLGYTMMRYDCLNQLRLLRRASARDARFERRLAEERTTLDPVAEVDAREQERSLARLGTLLLAVVSRCFHGLGLRDRRVLIGREIEGLTYDELADALELPRPQVGMILKRARERLALRIERALSAPRPHTLSLPRPAAAAHGRSSDVPTPDSPTESVLESTR